MLEHLAKQFLGSDAASEVIAAVMKDTPLDETQARQAVQATAEGASQAAPDLASLAGGLLGGGGSGLAGLAGGLLGGGGGGSSASSPLVETVTAFVAERTGLDPALARTVVGLALPKIVDYFQGPDGGSGGPLGGLFGS